MNEEYTPKMSTSRKIAITIGIITVAAISYKLLFTKNPEIPQGITKKPAIQQVVEEKTFMGPLPLEEVVKKPTPENLEACKRDPTGTFQIYTVVKGDTLYGIATRTYGVNLDKLAEHNGIPIINNHAPIEIGQRIEVLCNLYTHLF